MPDFHVKRCFFALPLDDTIRADMADLMERIDIDGLRLLDPDSLHVTLKFLGDVEDPQLPKVIAAGNLAADNIGSIDFESTELTCLPNARRPRVLALMLDASRNLQLLVERLEDATHEIGFRREGRLFRPHITLGRFRDDRRHGPRRQPVDLTGLTPPQTGYKADQMCLMESVLQRQGAFYSPLASFNLIRGAAPA